MHHLLCTHTSVLVYGVLHSLFISFINLDTLVHIFRQARCKQSLLPFAWLHCPIISPTSPTFIVCARLLRFMVFTNCYVAQDMNGVWHHLETLIRIQDTDPFKSFGLLGLPISWGLSKLAHSLWFPLLIVCRGGRFWSYVTGMANVWLGFLS